jgi:hypothetical protein
MLQIRTKAILPLLISGCLPPPADWPVSDSGDATHGVTDSGAIGVDSGDPVLACSSIIFDETGQVLIQGSDIESDGFYDNDKFTLDFWAWFLDSEQGVSRTLVSMGSLSSWWLGMDNTDLVFRTRDMEIRGAGPGSGWHHVALVKDDSPSEVRLYVDGTLFADALPFVDGFPMPGDDELRLGRSPDVETGWASSMDELRFANQVHYGGATMTVKDALDLDPWAGVWHFDGDLSNALNGRQAAGSGYEIVDSCP